jgi:hypothetical protein
MAGAGLLGTPQPIREANKKGRAKALPENPYPVPDYTPDTACDVIVYGVAAALLRALRLSSQDLDRSPELPCGFGRAQPFVVDLSAIVTSFAASDGK